MLNINYVVAKAKKSPWVSFEVIYCVARKRGNIVGPCKDLIVLKHDIFKHLQTMRLQNCVFILLRRDLIFSPVHSLGWSRFLGFRLVEVF